MPAFAFLENAPADANSIETKMRSLRKVGVPYTDEEIAGARKQLEGKSELDALIAYLQGMGLEMKNVR
jgi:cytochrome c oxidase cbb3-type subunit 2